MDTPCEAVCKARAKEREAEELHVDVLQNIENLYETLERVHYYLCDLEVLLERRVFGKDGDTEEVPGNLPVEFLKKRYWRPDVS